MTDHEIMIKDQLREDQERLDWHAANPERVYCSVHGDWWIRPLKPDGSVEYNTHPTAAGAARAIGPFTTFREAIDSAKEQA